MVFDEYMEPRRSSSVDDFDNAIMNVGLQPIFPHNQVQARRTAIRVHLCMEPLGDWSIGISTVEPGVQSARNVL